MQLVWCQLFACRAVSGACTVQVAFLSLLTCLTKLSHWLIE